MTKPLAAALAVLAWAAPGRAGAQQFPTQDPAFASPHFVGAGLDKVFGDAGGIVIRGAFDVGAFYANFQPPGVAAEAYSQTTLKVAPALDFFLSKNLALGGTVELGYATGRFAADPATGLPAGTLIRESHVDFAVGPEVGYNFAARRHASVFPTVGAVYRITSLTRQSPAGGDFTNSGFTISLVGSIPILYHLAQHFFIGFGPTVSIDIVSRFEGRDQTVARRLGLDFQIGGWL